MRIAVAFVTLAVLSVPAVAQGKSGSAPGAAGTESTPGLRQTQPGGAKTLAPGHRPGPAKASAPGQVAKKKKQAKKK
jgi:hypothetical protein